MENLRLITLRNIVDENFHGMKQLKLKLMKEDKITLKLVSATTREKIYNHFMDAIYKLRKNDCVLQDLKMLKKRIKVHLNQLKLLKETKFEIHKNLLNSTYDLLYLISYNQIKRKINQIKMLSK